jgi:signal transduction histidine kinase/CheY-like chemotaxis protein
MQTPAKTDLFSGLDKAPVGLAIWGATGDLIYANEPFRMLLPTEASIEMDQPYRGFLQAFLVQYGASMAHDLTGAPLSTDTISGKSCIWEQLLADGRTIEVHQTVAEDGGVTLTTHDVSNRKKIEFELRRARDAAETSDEVKSRFLRAANHDLRQPLATLKILIYSCLTELDHEHRQDLLHTMDMSVAIMEDLLGALLQIGQLDAGQIEPRVTIFQMSQIFERLEVQFEHQARTKGLEVRFRGHRYTASTDRALLERIVTNLVANAIRYTDTGRVVVGCRPFGDRLRIEVWDTGRGIGDEHLSRIFDEFYRVPDLVHTRRAGLGLGLNIVSRLAELLGIPVSVSSKPGSGTVFRLTVPAGDVWHSQANEPEISESLGGEFVGLNVVLIEDDPVLRDSMCALLERWGIVVLPAASMAETDRLLDATPVIPDLVIADFSLRGEFGTMAGQRLRERYGASLPVLIVTAEIDPEVVSGIRQQGFPVLIKPVSPPRLRVMMHNLLFENLGEQRGNADAF